MKKRPPGMFLSLSELGLAEPLKHGADFPKYLSPLINQANQMSQGTRPRVVGQLSEMYQSFPGHTLEEWEDWYSEQRPDGVTQAADLIWQMVCEFHRVLSNCTREDVVRWVRDLMFTKTYQGLTLQAAVLKKLGQLEGKPVRPSSAEEESRGIDGFVGDRPVSIKPWSYRKVNLSEDLEAEIVYYEPTETGITLFVDHDPILEMFG